METESASRGNYHIGDHCRQADITLWKLQNQDIPCILKSRLTNGAALELFSFMEKGYTQENIYQWIKKLYKDNNLWTEPSKANIFSALHRIKIVCKRLKKNRNSQGQRLENFLASPFPLPASSATDFKTKQLSKQSCKRKYECSECQALGEAVTNLAREVNEQRTAADDAQRKSIRLAEECVLLKNLKRKHLRSIRCKEMQLGQMKMKVKLQEKKLAKTKRKVLLQKVTHLQDKIRKLQNRKRNIIYRNKMKTTYSKPVDSSCLKRTLLQAQDRVRSLEQENDTLMEKLQVQQSQKIPTMHDGKTYNSAVRECVYFCATRQVSAKNTSPVIKFCVEKLSGIQVGKLPDESTCKSMIPEMRELSKFQLGEELASAAETTVKYDGTTKKRRHFSEVQIATKSSTYTVGIKEMAGGDACSYVETINTSLECIETSCEKPGLKQKILDNISNTMTDRHIVNKVANKKLAEQLTIRPTNDESPLNNFYCGMHPLDTFAKSAEKTVKNWEKDNNIPPEAMSFKHRGSSDAYALMQSLGRLCFKDGAGFPAEVKSHLQMNGVQKNPLQSIIGNRFHVYFLNGGACFFLRQLILDFLNKVWSPSNECLKAVKHDLEMDHCIIECRALGLVGKYLTGPWMRLIEQDIGILELNQYYSEAVEALTEYSKNAHKVVNGTAPPVFHDVPMQKDRIFQELTKQSNLDTQTSELLEKLFASIHEDCLRQLREQLPGGKFSDPTADVKRQAESCVGNNMSGERLFGQLDHQLKRAPNANVTYSESKLMYSNNETESWFSKKANNTVKEAMLHTARQRARIAKHCDQKRQHDIEQQRQQSLKDKRKEMERKEETSRVSRETLIDELSRHGGIWKSETEMNVALKDKSSGQQLFALKVQLNVRKKILQQKAPNDLFAFSSNRKPHTVALLKLNLVKLMQIATHQQADSTLEQALGNPSSLVGRDIQHLWTDEKGECWWHGTIKCRVDDSEEFLIEYQQSDNSPSKIVVYLEFSEIVADLRSGDLKLV